MGVFEKGTRKKAVEPIFDFVKGVIRVKGVRICFSGSDSG